ncbi:hypothetical protein B0H10DRAFT_1959743 [Mycena sp. CBHHK59/15]|nr:hypothetical protein B0H10DRAFT_1959743 [Mycena sp. CBHHK59/15]
MGSLTFVFHEGHFTDRLWTQVHLCRSLLEDFRATIKSSEAAGFLGIFRRVRNLHVTTRIPILLTANVLHSAPKTRVAKGDNRNWPQSISNVVPFGFDSLVRAVGQWCIILANPTPLMFLADALDLCGFPLFDAVTNSPTFLDLFIPSFRNTCTRLRSCRPPDKLPVPHLYMITVFLFRVIAGRSSYNSIMMWTKGRELELYGILSDAVTIFHAFAFHFSKDVERPPDLHPDLAPASNPSEPVDPIVDLLSMQTDACYATGCKRSFQEVGRAFRKCGACTRVAYCSRECQITDWIDAEFPHRVVCRQLQIFNEAGGSLKTNDREALLKVFDYSLGDSVIGPLHAWFKARVARKEIEDLQAHLESPEIVEVEQGMQEEIPTSAQERCMMCSHPWQSHAALPMDPSDRNFTRRRGPCITTSCGGFHSAVQLWQDDTTCNCGAPLHLHAQLNDETAPPMPPALPPLPPRLGFSAPPIASFNGVPAVSHGSVGRRVGLGYMCLRPPVYGYVGPPACTSV